MIISFKGNNQTKPNQKGGNNMNKVSTEKTKQALTKTNQQLSTPQAKLEMLIKK